MQKHNQSIIIWVLFFLFIFSFLLYNSLTYLDPDFGWHLRVGEQILAEEAVPTLDYYDYTLVGEEWVDHEWLLNVLTYTVFTILGYISLNILFSLILLFTLIILAVFTYKYLLNSRGLFLILIFELFGVLAISPHIGVRMQEIALLNLLLLIIILHFYEKNRNYKVLFALLPLFYFWVNAHASFLVGIFLLFLFLGVKLISSVLVKFRSFAILDNSSRFNWKDLLVFLLFAIAATATTLLTPYGLKLFSFLREYSDTYYMTHVAEWLPAWSWPINYLQQFYRAAVSVVVILSLLSIYKQIKSADSENKTYEINLWYLALAILFLFLSFQSKRHFPLLFIASFPLVAQFLFYDIDFPEYYSRELGKNSWLKFYLTFVVILVVSMFMLQTNFTNSPFTSSEFCGQYPCEAVDFLKNHPEYINKKIYNDYGWGGFLIWVYPEKKLFIDGRLPIYRYGEHSLLEEYNQFNDEKKVAEKLSAHDIGMVLIKKRSEVSLNWFEKYVLGLNENIINKEKKPLKEYLDNSSEWELKHVDPISLVYIKN